MRIADNLLVSFIFLNDEIWSYRGIVAVEVMVGVDVGVDVSCGVLAEFLNAP
jgi:hypothetical protein